MKKFMRTRDPAPAPLQPQPQLNGHAHLSKTNGHASGARDERDEQLSSSTASSRGRGGTGGGGRGRGRYWGAPDVGTVLWEDDEFPPQRALHKRLAKNVVWMRPHELCARPTLRGAGVGGGDAADVDDEPDDEFAARWRVEAGALGSAALCDACAALALTPRLLARVVPAQSFRARYAGAFRFTFWVFGEWVDVCVDDRLPTRGGRLLASRSALPGDFTVPLLEKAYAKLYGGYAALREVRACQALQDVSGGVVQSFPLAAGGGGALALQVLHSAAPRSTLLVAGAHVVAGLARVRAAGGDTLVRLRAASGRRGGAAWAPGGPQWRALPAPDRDLLDRCTLNGEFWVSFSELRRAHSTLVLVHVGPDDWVMEPALQARRPWRAVLARRRWRVGYNAGGPPGAPTAAANPQFRVSVPARPTGAAKCHVVVAVTQQYRPAAPCRLHAVGFAVYLLPDALDAPDAPADDLSALRPLDVTHCCRAREVATFFTLPAGPAQYLVVPHTQRPHVGAAFLLRILTDEHTDVWEVNEDNAILHDAGAEVGGWGRAPGRGWGPDELEAEALRAALRGGACGRGPRASLALCRALAALCGGAQQGAGGAGAALRARRPAGARRLRGGAGPPAPRARALPQPRFEVEVQSSLLGRDDPDDYLHVRRDVWSRVAPGGTL